MLTEQEERELKEQVTKLTAALEKLTATPEPTKIPWDGTKSIEADLQAVAEGRIVLEQPEKPEEHQLKDNEISRTDRRKINANIAKIASGEMVVVD